MPITGTFLADFSQFNSAVQGAGTNLRAFEGKADQVGTAVQGMGASATSALSVVRTMAGAMGVAFSVGAVVQFAGRVFDAASNIHDMSLKLGISTNAVQGFKFAAEQAGTTIDTVGTAINRMNVNLAEGNKGTVAALKAAGLEFDKIRSMKPEEAFLAITDAVAKIEDPMQRAQIMTELFGKSAVELLPAVEEGFRKVSDSASKMSAETIASLERAQDAWEAVGNKFVIVTGTMIAKAIEFWGVLREQNFGGFGNAAKKAAEEVDTLPPVLAKTTEQLKAEEAAADKATRATLATAGAAEKLEAAWRKANIAGAAKAASDARNLEGMQQMEDAIAAQERAVLNNEGIWMMNRDAATMATEARDAEVKAEIEAQKELDASLTEGVLVVGQYTNANKEAGETAKVATAETVQGYAAVASQVTMTGDAIRAFIELQKYSAAANAILREGPLFMPTSSSQYRRISQLPQGGSGGGPTVQVNVSGVFDAHAKEALTAAVAEGLTQSMMQGTRLT